MVFRQSEALRELVGELGGNLELISRLTAVELVHRGQEIAVYGAPEGRLLAQRVLAQLTEWVERGRALERQDVEQVVRAVRADASSAVGAWFRDVVLTGVTGKPITPRTAGQASLLDALRRHDITFAYGPAGTGKTYMAVAVAVAAMMRGEVDRIILSRPAVEAGEHLGFLPGDLNEKVDPYLRPLHDALFDMIPRDRLERLTERGQIEVAPLAFMRGRTLHKAWVILDEAQNTTVEQMKMFLTRLGTDSKMVITGDLSQVDLPRGRTSGMALAIQLLAEVKGIGITRLSARDVVRHPLVAEIVRAWDGAEDA
ncbi:MAG: PhoH family protein [Deltaproteobacteria bacterium]|nr:PhoH family protein [Deltaproteobacteria bacterium]